MFSKGLKRHNGTKAEIRNLSFRAPHPEAIQRHHETENYIGAFLNGLFPMRPFKRVK